MQSGYITCRFHSSRRHGRLSPKVGGFSLIELIVVIAIVAILAAIAYPSYSSSLKNARRSDARAALYALAVAMERHYTETSPSTYEGAAIGGNNTGPPAIFPGQAPLDGATKYYDLLIHSATTSAYEIHARPAGGQSGDPCGTFTLSSYGQRGILGNIDNWTNQRCWKR